MPDLKLYQYPEAIDAILEAAEGGELTVEAEAELDSLLGGLQEKAKSVVAVIRQREMLRDRCKVERQRLAAMEGILGNQVDSLKRYLIRCMAHEEVNRVVSELGTVSKVASPVKIRWEWTDRLPPAEFVQTQVVSSVNLDAARKAHREGRLPEGFAVERDEHLRIK